MAFSHTHRPQFSGQMFTNSSIRGDFGDSLTELDWEVGQIMGAIEEAGIQNDTFVFFTSDNGYVCACWSCTYVLRIHWYDNELHSTENELCVFT